jgi:hypothetical protein
LINDEVQKSFGNGETVNFQALQSLLGSFDQKALQEIVKSNGGVFKVNFDKKDIELKQGQHFFLSGRDRFN